MLRVTLNGKERDFDGEKTILEALRETGIQVPTLCHDPRLKPYGGCRLCLVAVKGIARPVTACNTRLEKDMVVDSHTPEIEDLRRTLLQLLARPYPKAATVEFPEKEFHQILHDYGIEAEAGWKRPVPGNLKKGGEFPGVDLSHPAIAVDMSRCVTCMRCVRICGEVQGQFVWRVENRGDRTLIVPDGPNLKESSCVSCGACVDACPTGALEDQAVLSLGSPQTWTKTTCPYCAVGCEMMVGTVEGKIRAVRPALESPVNKGHLCVKGRYAFGFNDHPDRVTEPMIREDGSWRKVSWEEAFVFTAERLKGIIARHGPGVVGVLGSARATNEENYLAQKFARGVLGTNNVDCCARVCHTPSAAALKGMLGAGAATNCFDDIELAKALMVVGSNPTENHPVVGARIKQRALLGVPLIVIDPRETELARHALVHLAPRPGTNIPLLNALAQVIVEEGLFDEDFLFRRAEETKEFFDFVREWTPEKAEDICGVKAGEIRRAARLYAGGKPSMCFHGLGVTEHSQGTEGVMLLVNLALLTGNLGKPGAGENPLRGQNNVQGSAQMGCDPSILTGSVPLKEAATAFGKTWGVPLPESKGLNLMEMLDAAVEGSFKALWVMGYDVFLSHPNSAVTRRAFEGMELVIIQDLFMNETAREFGKVFLPTTSSFEKEGTFMNSERRIQRVRKVLEPPGGAKTDWEILQGMAQALGKGGLFPYGSAEDIWNEVRELWPGARGITYARMEKAGLQWPCPDEAHPGTEILHMGLFSNGGKAALKRVGFRPTPEITNGDFPLLLSTGRCLYQFNAGTMTTRSVNEKLRHTDFLDLSPTDASRLALSNGDKARVVSRYGEALIPVRVDIGIKPGECFATFHTVKVFLNQVTGPHRDRFVQTPEYKVTAVRIEKL